MNTNTKAMIIMDELLDIVNGRAVDQSKSKDPIPLTVQDIINQLIEMVSENPESAKYQIAEYSYDDFAVGPAYAVFSVKSIDVIGLPEDSEDEFVSNKLTTSKIVIFST